jgi:hypothetical protein
MEPIQDDRPMLAPTEEQKAAYLRQQSGPTVDLADVEPIQDDPAGVTRSMTQDEWDAAERKHRSHRKPSDFYCMRCGFHSHDVTCARCGWPHAWCADCMEL